MMGIWEHKGNVENMSRRRVFHISRVFSNVLSVLSQCNTRPRLFHLLYDVERLYTRKLIKHAFSMFYTLTKHGFLTNQSVHYQYYNVIYCIDCDILTNKGERRYFSIVWQVIVTSSFATNQINPFAYQHCLSILLQRIMCHLALKVRLFP